MEDGETLPAEIDERIDEMNGFAGWDLDVDYSGIALIVYAINQEYAEEIADYFDTQKWGQINPLGAKEIGGLAG